MKKYIGSALFPIVLIGLAAAFLYWEYYNLKNSTPNVYVTVESQHSSIGGLNIGNQRAWGRLLVASDLRNVKLIKSEQYIVITSPLQWFQLIITDKEQGSIILRQNEGKVLSSLGLVYNGPSSLLTAYLYIDPEFISDENINNQVIEAIWAITITNEVHPSDQLRKIQNYSKYISRSGHKLVEDIVFTKK